MCEMVAAGGITENSIASILSSLWYQRVTHLAEILLCRNCYGGKTSAHHRATTICICTDMGCTPRAQPACFPAIYRIRAVCSPWIRDTNAYFEPRLLSLVKHFSAVIHSSVALNSRCMSHYCRLYNWARAPCNADRLTIFIKVLEPVPTSCFWCSHCWKLVTLGKQNEWQ